MTATDRLTQAVTDGRVPFSEDDLADKFSTEHRDDLRYCEAWKRWLVWDQSRWRPDITVRIFGLVREVCSHAAALCNQPSRKIASAATIAAVSLEYRSSAARSVMRAPSSLPAISKRHSATGRGPRS